jgi:SAM-dependent methyltransferase
MEVLQVKSQIAKARHELTERGASFTDSCLRSIMRRLGFVPGVAVGDKIKSWDVLKTIELIEERIPKDAPVLDIGAYASEVPLILHRLGYRRIAGVDLNPGITKMSRAEEIDYRVGDFLRAPFPDHSFDAITAISVIEHGFQGERLATEMARMLRPGGLFIASFDYWPEKIPTAGIDMFGMSWTIFSRQDIEQFVALAGERGLFPCGPLTFDSADKPVSCAGRDYTFGWMALKKIA